MGLTLELPPDLADALADEAARLGVPLADYAVRLLAARSAPPVRTGADLVAYWHAEGVVGCRSATTDSPTYARVLRERSQYRERT